MLIHLLDGIFYISLNQTSLSKKQNTRVLQDNNEFYPIM